MRHHNFYLKICFALFLLILNIKTYSQSTKEDWVIKMNNRFLNYVEHIIQNSPDLLNKTFYEIYFKENENPTILYIIKNCPRSVIEPVDKSNYEKVVTYNCGSGYIELFFRPNTSVSYFIRVVNNSVWLYNEDFFKWIQTKYKIRSDGWSEPIFTNQNNIRAVFKLDISSLGNQDLVELQISHLDNTGKYIKY